MTSIITSPTQTPCHLQYITLLAKIISHNLTSNYIANTYQLYKIDREMEWIRGQHGDANEYEENYLYSGDNRSDNSSSEDSSHYSIEDISDQDEKLSSNDESLFDPDYYEDKEDNIYLRETYIKWHAYLVAICLIKHDRDTCDVTFDDKRIIYL